MNHEVGQRIRRRRKALDLTQEQVAERSGLSQNFLAAVERGARGLGTESIKRLSNTLQISTDYIVLGKVGAEDRNRILALTKPLNSEQLLYLEEIVKAYVKGCGCTERQEMP